MCFGRRRGRSTSSTKKTKTKKAATDSPIEKTADKVVIGDERTLGETTPKIKKKFSSNKVTGGKAARAIAPRRLGTRSLQIPLLANTTAQGNLNYF